MLNDSGLGLPLKGMNISILKFADDIVLLAKSKEAMKVLMAMTRQFFD